MMMTEIDPGLYCTETLGGLYRKQRLHEDMLPYSDEIRQICYAYAGALVDMRAAAAREGASFLFRPLSEAEVHRALVAMRKAGRLPKRDRPRGGQSKSRLIGTHRAWLARQLPDIPIDRVPYTPEFDDMLDRFNTEFGHEITCNHRQLWLEFIRVSKRGGRE